MTIRILTAQHADGVWTGSGTGFFFADAKGDAQLPMIVTNKHVISNAVTVGLNFHETSDNNKTPVPGAGRLHSIPIQELKIVRHPDPDVDLAGIMLHPVIEHIQRAEGWQPYVKGLTKSFYPSAEVIAEMSSIEEIIMVGYPTGLYDTMNNFPIVRRGITSTPYHVNYRGKKEFLADIPVFGGSSGSPILIVNEGSFSTAGGIALGSRFMFLGVLHSGHVETINGCIVAEPVPTNFMPVAKVIHMINLGICIKSCLVEELVKAVPGW